MSEFIKRLKVLSESLNTATLETRIIDYAIDVIKKNDYLFIEQNIEQLKASKKADGSNITPLYADSTQQRKGYSKPDLFETGEFYDNFFMDVDREIITLRSERFEKGFDVRKHLLNKYGVNIEGVNKQFLKEFCRQILKPDVRLFVRKELNI